MCINIEKARLNLNSSVLSETPSPTHELKDIFPV